MLPIIYGDQIQLFVQEGNEWKSIAYATNHTLTFSSETSEISSKDNGVFGSTVVQKVNFEISGSYFYSKLDFNTLLNYMINRTQITVLFGDVKDWVATGLEDNSSESWKPDTTTSGAFLKKGTVVISNITMNANNGETCSYDITLSGSGSLTDMAHHT